MWLAGSELITYEVICSSVFEHWGAIYCAPYLVMHLVWHFYRDYQTPEPELHIAGAIHDLSCHRDVLYMYKVPDLTGDTTDSCMKKIQTLYRFNLQGVVSEKWFKSAKQKDLYVGLTTSVWTRHNEVCIYTVITIFIDGSWQNNFYLLYSEFLKYPLCENW